MCTRCCVGLLKRNEQKMMVEDDEDDDTIRYRNFSREKIARIFIVCVCEQETTTPHDNATKWQQKFKRKTRV